MSAVRRILRRGWAGLRALAGEDAYERYLSHHRRCHPERAPLDPAAFYRAEQERRWSQVNRCC